jgi:glycosyltransferase involved in cell wall biosynthesis
MRVLHVIHEYDYAEGMGRTIDTLARENGAENILLCARLKKGSSEMSQTIVKKRLSTRAVRDVAITTKADVIHFHGGVFSAIFGSLVKINGVKKVSTIYGWPRAPKTLAGLTFKQAWGTPPLNKRVLIGSLVPVRLVAFVLGKTPIVTPDHSVFSRLSSRGTRVFNYETATMPAERTAVRNDRDEIVLAVAGRAELTRGADVFMGVVASLNARGVKTRGVIAALPGPHSNQIAQLAEGRDDIRLIQGVADLTEIFSESDVVVMPFRADYTTSPPVLVAEEALACGVPVVTSDVTCMKTAVDTSCAAVLGSYSVKAYVEAVLSIVSNEELYKQLKDGAKTRPERAWAKSNVVEITQRAYDS